MPSRENEFWANRREEELGEYRRALCYFCGTDELCYDQNSKLWICLNKKCSHFEKPVLYISGGTVNFNSLLTKKHIYSDNKTYVCKYEYKLFKRKFLHKTTIVMCSLFGIVCYKFNGDSCPHFKSI